ncbi:MAG: histidinol-phosphatase family [Thermosediminibacterales bacterium]|nr:histidinol-phosphatase family [Thermosediminibacterales bacterium]
MANISSQTEIKLWDYHVHLENGLYTIEWLQKFLETAQKRGLKEVGFSEHAYRFKQAAHLMESKGFRKKWAEKYCTEDIDEYINLVEKAKSEGLPVKLGIEMDFIPEHEEKIKEFIDSYPWDYVLGSVHWLDEWGFDIPDLKDEWDRRDILEVYKSYFELLGKAAESRIFDIMAHPDVIKVFGYKPDHDLTDIYEKTAKVFKNSDVCIEISSAGLRKPVGEIYPSKEFLEVLKKYDLPVIINSDAHYPEHVGKDFDKVLKYIKPFNLDKICSFENRKRKEVKLT